MKISIARAGFFCLLLSTSHIFAGPEDHIEDDQFWADMAKLAPVEEVEHKAAVITAGDRIKYGTWGSVISWPHIPVTAFNLPNGKVVTFASNRTNSFPSGVEFTHAAVYDPTSNQAPVINNHPSHDMFCAHPVMLEDGRTFLMGGRNTVKLTSVFDWQTETWQRTEPMNDGRWYPTATFLSGNNVMVASGSGGTNTVEVGSPEGGFRRLNISWAGIAGATGFESRWWPLNFLAPNGYVFHAGPTDRMHWVNPNGNGQLIDSGKNVPGSWYPKHSAVAMYRKGKLIIAGGAPDPNNGLNATSAAYTVDLNGTSPVVTQVASMNNSRRFGNSIMLPDGNFLVIGGNTSGRKFSDSGTVYEAETWNPDTNQWTRRADMTIPRNYHSVALLLSDGRVFAGGGGLNGTSSSNHPDVQIYSPYYLYNSNGSAASRPVITSNPSTLRPGGTAAVSVSGNVSRFTMIRMIATTHGLSTDLRFLEVPFVDNGGGNYELTLDPNPNVLTPGFWTLWALDSNDVPSVAKNVQVIKGDAPTLFSPGDQAMLLGNDADVDLTAEDKNNDQLTWSANGLPNGLSINSSTGNITGTASQEGEFSVTITVDDSIDGTDSVDINWSVIANPTVPTAGLTHFWEFETNGSSSIGNVTASLKNGAAVTTDSRRGKVLDFDGTNDYVSIPVDVSEEAQTYAFWFKTSAPGRGIFSAVKDELGTSTDRMLYLDGSNIGGRLWSNEVITSSGQNFADGKWHHLVYTHGYTDGASLQPGLEYSYFHGDWTVLPNFATLFPEKSGVVSNFSLVPRSRDGDFGFDYRGLIEVDAAGTYTFYTSSDDGSRLWINDQLIVDNDGVHSNQERSGQVTLTQGLHKIRVGYFENGGSEVLNVSYAGPDISKQAIPDDKLFHGGGQKIYIDGEQVAGGTRSLSNFNTQDRLHLGFSRDGEPDYFKGQIDDFRIYNRGMSAADAVSLSGAGTINLPPVLTNPGNQTDQVGNTVSLTINASDPENLAMTFSAANLPNGLSINAASGVVSGTLTQPGVFNVSVTVNDQEQDVSTSFSWTVRGVLDIPPVTTELSEAGADVNYTINGGAGLTYTWNFGDGSANQTTTNGNISHQFATPGRYNVTVNIQDDTGQTQTLQFTQAVHDVITANTPNVSQSIVYEARTGSADRVWNVNPDNDTVTVINAVTGTKIQEIDVETDPRSLAIDPNGLVWVTNKKSASISLIDPDDFSVSTVLMASNSQPHGIVFSPTGDFAYVALEALGAVAKLDPSTGAQMETIIGLKTPRHLSVSHDGLRLYVSRFVTGVMPSEAIGAANPGTNDGGEIYAIATTDMSLAKTIVLHNSTRPDASDAARGIPNYVGPLALSPDNKKAWVASKQDNLERGTFRDGNTLNHDKSIRSVSSFVDLTDETENQADRVDHDNAGVAVTSLFGPKGSLVYVALEGSRNVAVIDPWSLSEIKRFKTDRAPQGLAISPDGKTLFVHNFMSRNVTIHDVTELVDGIGDNVPKTATVSTVASEKLAANVLIGKQHFYDAEDTRLALQEYISCAACHNDGGHDGRIWDFTQFGEGLRNTTDLRGRGGMAHGNLHWTANFDEVQDFEAQIRSLAGGTGFLTNTQFNQTSDPLGAAKAGLSSDLDALAAYVSSLATEPASPFQENVDQGETLFVSNNCNQCHKGTTFSDSIDGLSHDIGTIIAASGNASGNALTAIDTPSLRGAWAGAPYLHNGSAATIEAAIQAHQGITLNSGELASLAAYIRQIDTTVTTAPGEDDPVDPVNLLTNPNFEDGLSGWDQFAVAGGNIAIVSNTNGSNAVALTGGFVYREIPVTGDTDYVLSATYRSTGSPGIVMGIEYRDSSGAVASSFESSFPPSTNDLEARVEGKAPSNATTAVIYFWGDPAGTTTIDNFVFAEKLPDGGGGGDDELLTNGDFEQDLTGWLVHQVTGGTSAIVNNADTTKSMSLSGAFVYRFITITGDSDYIFTARYKNDGTSPGMAMGIEFSDAAGTSLETKDIFPNPSADFNTASVSAYAPPTATTATVYFWGDPAGTTIVDDFSFKADDPPVVDDNLLTNGSFESGTTGWNSDTTLETVTQASEGAAAIKIDTGIMHQTVSGSGGDTYTFSGSYLSTGSPGIEVGIAFLDSAGTELDFKFSTLTPSGTYTSFTITEPASPGTTSILVYCFGGAGGTVTVDDFKLTK